jgi:hypothetical protein
MVAARGITGHEPDLHHYWLYFLLNISSGPGFRRFTSQDKLLSPRYAPHEG